MKYLVVQEVSSETKVSKNIFLFDLFFILVFFTVSAILGSLVHSSFRILYYIFSAVVALFLTGKSGKNRKRRNYESIILYLKKDREVYHPETVIDDREVEDEEEGL